MQDKESVKNQYADLDEMLGNPKEIRFSDDDKIKFMSYIPLKKFSDFMNLMSIININTLWTNFLHDESSDAVKEVLKMTFSTYDVEEIMEEINAENFPIVMKKILSLNGIIIDQNNSEDTNGPKAPKKKE